MTEQQIGTFGELGVYTLVPLKEQTKYLQILIEFRGYRVSLYQKQNLHTCDQRSLVLILCRERALAGLLGFHHL